MKAMDKLIDNVKFEKKYVLFCMIIVILGIITGSFFIVILNSADKNLVMEYITSFIDNIKNNNNFSGELLVNTLLTNYITIFILFIMGFCFFLFPINILILFYKAFIIGFTLASFIMCYKIKGVIFSIIYIFPHLIINILIFCLISAFTIKISTTMIKYIVKKKEVNMRVYFNKYFSIILLSSIIILITNLYESYIVPYLLKLFSSIL